MMNKRGFTLAEVLITLGIIGVIAAMTVPTLMNNSTEMEFRSAFKKGLASLNQAVTMNVAIDNVDFDSLTDSSVGDTERDSLYALLANRMTTAKFLNAADTSQDTKLLNIGGATGVGSGATADGSPSNGTGNVAMFFTDGSAIIWKPGDVSTAARTGGIKVIWDVNGSKKPNRLTHCGSTTPPNRAAKATQDTDSCNDKNIVIRDQFSVTLKGNRALPNGKAAHYLFYMK